MAILSTKAAARVGDLVSWLVALFEYAFQGSGESPGAQHFPDPAEDHAGMHHLSSIHGYGYCSSAKRSREQLVSYAFITGAVFFLLRILAP